MVGCFNITASLDYDYVVAAGSVHVLTVRSGHFGMRSKHTFTSVSPRNKSIPHPFRILQQAEGFTFDCCAVDGHIR